MKMGVTRFIILTCLVICVNAAQKSRMERKFDALDNLFQSKMILVNDELETGRLERESLMEKYNKTMEFLETQCKANGKTLANGNIESQKDKQKDIKTDELSKLLFLIKQGVKQEKMARVTDRKAVSHKLVEIQNNQINLEKNLDESKQSQNQMQENLKETEENLNKMQNEMQIHQNELQDKLNKTQEKLNEMQVHQKELQISLNEMQNIQREMKTKQNEMVTNMNNIISNQKHLDRQLTNVIQDVKQIKAPKLYCNNKLELEACLEEIFTQQKYLIGIHPVILVDGRTPYEGRVEVNYNGRRGTVCNDVFDNNAARVVCRMLRYNGGIAMSKDGACRFCQKDQYFGPGSGEILLDAVRCNGNEPSIFDCHHKPIGDHNCGHHEDVGVRCDP